MDSKLCWGDGCLVNRKHAIVGMMVTTSKAYLLLQGFAGTVTSLGTSYRQPSSLPSTVSREAAFPALLGPCKTDSAGSLR